MLSSESYDYLNRLSSNCSELLASASYASSVVQAEGRIETHTKSHLRLFADGLLV